MDGTGDESLRQELNGANRLAEFRLQKVNELQDEVQRLRQLVLDSQSGRAGTRKTFFSGRRDKSSIGATRCLRGGTSSPSLSVLPLSNTAVTSTPSPRQKGWKKHRTPSPSPHPFTTATAATAAIGAAAATGGRNVISSKPRMSSVTSESLRRGGSCSGNGVSRRFFSLTGRVAHLQSSSSSRVPQLDTTPAASVRLRSATRPFIKLHTGVKLCGPKTLWQKAQSPPSPLVDKAVYGAGAPDVFVAGLGNGGGCYGSTTAPPGPQSVRLHSSVFIRREYEGVRDALAMLRGILLRADRNMLSTLTALSNRRGVDHAFPAAIAELKQCLLRSHPSLSGKLHEGEAWRIDEEDRDALEVVVVPAVLGTLREVVITHDYTRCVYQNVLNQDEGVVSIQLAKAFHEFYANIYILLAISQCPSTLC